MWYTGEPREITDMELAEAKEDLLDTAEILIRLYEEKHELEEELKQVESEIGKAKSQLAYNMKNAKMSKLRYNNATFTSYFGQSVSRIMAEQKRLVEELYQRGYLNSLQVKPYSLRNIVIAAMHENDGALPDWLEGLVRVENKTIVTVRTKHNK